MFIALGNLYNGVEMHETLFNPVEVSPSNRIRNVRSAIHLATHEGEIDFRAAIARNKFWLSHADQVGKGSAHDINAMADGLGAQPYPRNGAEFFKTVWPSVFASRKNVLSSAIGRAEINEPVEVIENPGLAE